MEIDEFCEIRTLHSVHQGLHSTILFLPNTAVMVTVQEALDQDFTKNYYTPAFHAGLAIFSLRNFHRDVDLKFPNPKKAGLDGPYKVWFLGLPVLYGRDNMGQTLQAVPTLGDSRPCPVEYEWIEWRQLGCLLDKGTHFHGVTSQFL